MTALGKIEVIQSFSQSSVRDSIAFHKGSIGGLKGASNVWLTAVNERCGTVLHCVRNMGRAKAKNPFDAHHRFTCQPALCSSIISDAVTHLLHVLGVGLIAEMSQWRDLGEDNGVGYGDPARFAATRLVLTGT